MTTNAADLRNSNPDDREDDGRRWVYLGADLEAGGDDLAAELPQAGVALPSLPLLGVTGRFIEGWSHLIASAPRAGKTELLVACAREWCAAGTTVLYLSEEPRSIWQMRLSAYDGDWSRLRVVFALGVDPARLYDRAFGGDEQVVVVDTLRNLLQLHNENDNSECAGILNPWVAGARHAEKTLIMGHHMRKGAGDHGEGIAGGHALMAVFDVAIELRRDSVPNRRALKFHSRLFSPPDLLYERTAEGLFQVLGDPERPFASNKSRSALWRP